METQKWNTQLLVNRTLFNVLSSLRLHLWSRKVFSLSRLHSNTTFLGGLLVFFNLTVTENNNISVENKEQAGSGI